MCAPQMTVVVAGAAYFLLCSSVETASFLTPEERVYAAARLNADKPQSVAGVADADAFSWYQVRRAIFNIQTWLSALAYFSILSALYSFGTSPDNPSRSDAESDYSRKQVCSNLPSSTALDTPLSRPSCTLSLPTLSQPSSLSSSLSTPTAPRPEDLGFSSAFPSPSPGTPSWPTPGRTRSDTVSRASHPRRGNLY